MEPKGVLSFPQVTAKPEFYITFRYSDAQSTSLCCRHITGLPHIGRPQQLLQHSAVMFGGCVGTSFMFPSGTSMWLISIWSGKKSQFRDAG
jgi:hypothetical protein